jgi:hypothetical protein
VFAIIGGGSRHSIYLPYAKPHASHRRHPIWAGLEFGRTVDWENLMKEKSHVHRKQAPFWYGAGSD